MSMGPFFSGILFELRFLWYLIPLVTGGLVWFGHSDWMGTETAWVWNKGYVQLVFFVSLAVGVAIFLGRLEQVVQDFRDEQRVKRQQEKESQDTSHTK